MAPYLLEEAYETVEVLDDPERATEELGDLLFTLVSIATIREEQGLPGLEETARANVRKMQDRHPKLFGHPEDTRTWQELKGPARPGLGVAHGLPSLLRAQRVGEAAARRGFDWPDASGPRAKVVEELAEVDDAVERAHAPAVHEEFGDLLFSIVNLARHHGVDAETALADATSKFERRFAGVEAAVEAAGGDVQTLDATALEATWQAVKSEEDAC